MQIMAQLLREWTDMNGCDVDKNMTAVTIYQ